MHNWQRAVFLLMLILGSLASGCSQLLRTTGGTEDGLAAQPSQTNGDLEGQNAQQTSIPVGSIPTQNIKVTASAVSEVENPAGSDTGSVEPETPTPFPTTSPPTVEPTHTPTRQQATPTVIRATSRPSDTSAAVLIDEPTPSPSEVQAEDVNSSGGSPTVNPVAHTYFFPVQPATVADYNPYHHDYPAADIFAPCGTDFVAVTDGVIHEYRGNDNWNPATNDPAERGGLFVSIIGNDGVRYYASHLQSIVPDLQEGQVVSAGQLLGTVGNTGNARGIACHVHFGISPPTEPGDWYTRRGLVAPYDYLQAWERGESETPDLSAVTSNADG